MRGFCKSSSSLHQKLGTSKSNENKLTGYGVKLDDPERNIKLKLSSYVSSVDVAR